LEKIADGLRGLDDPGKPVERQVQDEASHLVAEQEPEELLPHPRLHAPLQLLHPLEIRQCGPAEISLGAAYLLYHALMAPLVDCAHHVREEPSHLELLAYANHAAEEL